MATSKNIKIVLNDEEVEFINWLAKRDEKSFQDELQMTFYTELRALMDLYLGEMRLEKYGRKVIEENS